HAQVDPADSLVLDGVDVFAGQGPVAAQTPAVQIEIVGRAQRGLPDGRRLERRVDGGGVARAEVGAVGHAVLQVGVRLGRIDVRRGTGGADLQEAIGLGGRGVARQAAAVEAGQVAGVAEGVGDPDVGRTALIATEAAVDRQVVGGAPVEAEARLDLEDAVQ